jgi:hypothetical protein
VSSYKSAQDFPLSKDHGGFSVAESGRAVNDSLSAELEGRGWRKIVSGTWFYDRTVPMRMSVWAKPARLASSRFDEDDHLDESKPIPETKDGYLYCCWPGNCGEPLTIEDAKSAADTQPWGPVTWDR